MTIAFITPPHDRQSHFRNDSVKILDLRRDCKAKFIKVCQESVLLRGAELDLSAIPEASPAVFLGQEQETPWFAATTTEQPGLVTVRELMLQGALPATQLTLVAQAKSMLGWHMSHGFCAKCGQPTEMADAGYRRHCAACSTDHFPRTDPVVIMAVTCRQELLLGRQATWPTGMFSALAGFMEPGETIEQAVAREVKEESGVNVHSVRYVTSQPWPYPSSLMIGAIARTDSKSLVIDTTEIETARWFGIKEIELMLNRNHPEGLTAAHPYAIAHQLIRYALEECKKG
jgi:NAD+ diphosphatase